MVRLVLGTESRTRRAIAESIPGIEDLAVIPSRLDESEIGRRDASPDELVLTIGKAKAEALLPHLRPSYNGWFLLTGDQVVVYKNKILEKPKSVDEAVDLYRAYSSNRDLPVQTVGSVVLTDITTGIQVTTVDVSAVQFTTPLTEKEIGMIGPDCMSCAGALMIEHSLVEPHITIKAGTHEGVLGLDKNTLQRLLHQLSHDVALFRRTVSGDDQTP